MKHAKTPTKSALLRRIRRSSAADKATGCRIWSLYTTRSGRPVTRINRNRSSVSVRKLVYELTTGPVPEGHDVVAICRCAGCIEPKHLEAKPRKGFFSWLAEIGALETVEAKSRRVMADSVTPETRAAVRAKILAIKASGSKLTADALAQIAADCSVSVHWVRNFARRGMPDRRNTRTPEAIRTAVRERLTAIRAEVGDRASRSATMLEPVAKEFGVTVKWLQKFARTGMQASRPVMFGGSSIFRLGESIGASAAEGAWN